MKLKKSIYLALVVLTGVALALTLGSRGSAETTGNGAPSGPHFDLNLIGVDKGCPVVERLPGILGNIGTGPGYQLR